MNVQMGVLSEPRTLQAYASCLDLSVKPTICVPGMDLAISLAAWHVLPCAVSADQPRIREVQMMKSRIAVFVCMLSTMQYAAAADTVVGTTPDTALGKGIGGMSGFLVGGAVAGPIGAIGVGLASLWLGGEVQEASGLHDDAYVVQSEDGSTQTVRSPNVKVAVGDQVQVVSRRLVPVSTDSD